MPKSTRALTTAVVALLSLTVTLGCAGVGATPAAAPDRSPEGALSGPGAGPPPMDAPEASGAAATVRRALERALERGGRWQELRVETECLQDASLRHVEIFGSGTTIWNERRQITLEHGDLVAVLEAILRADFPSMHQLYGKGDPEMQQPDESGEGAAIRVICRVVLTLDGVTKQSAQRAQGPQSEELESLAEEIFALVSKPEQDGVTAEDLGDGLAKVADGRLAPEALRVLLHRKDEDVEAGTPEAPRDAGYLLRLEGRRLRVSPFRQPGGYGDPVETELDADRLGELANLLADDRVGELPANLYAGHYADLVVEVLNREARVQARRFANLSPKTHGEKQERFERIEEALDALARRMLADS